MALIENIREDIEEMFAEFVIGSSPENKINSSTAKQILGIAREDRITEFKKTEGKEWRCCHTIDGCLILESDTLKVTTKRTGIFYKRAGQILTAYDLLKTGLYSGREICRITGIAKDTIFKLIRKMGGIKCICGTPILIHRGWCSHRFAKSEKRQEFINRWNLSSK